MATAPAPLCFATSSADKLREAQDCLGRPVEGVALELEELQTTDMRHLLAHKAEQAYAAVARPVLVEDTALVFRAWGELPGPFVKFFLAHLGLAGMVRALEPFADMGAEARCGVAHHDGRQVQYTEGRVAGTIVMPSGSGGFGWDPIFRPQGFARTYAEMSPAEKAGCSPRTQALQRMAQRLGHP